MNLSEMNVVKPVLWLVLLGVSLVGCSIPQAKDHSLKSISAVTDTSNFAILEFTRYNSGPFDSTEVKATSLNEIEIFEVHYLVAKAIREYNANIDSADWKWYAADLQKGLFNRQYIPVINGKGEKVVWVNFFCDAGNKAWRTTEVFVHDGGNCYFNLLVNLTTKSTSDFFVNGYA
ncbi:MAG: hypothetical protein EOO88_44295 [Pedobacter sp.]|nr:MAG: hypothetical protein EOO88_44295 [Pedobacter sp.]